MEGDICKIAKLVVGRRFSVNCTAIHCTVGPLDQQDIDRRADVLVFETAKAMDPLYLTGALNAHLFLSSDAVDTDFMVMRRL